MIRDGPREIEDGEARLREVALEDAAALYRWRMDPASRPMFVSTGEVPYETHAAFLRRYFALDNTDRWFVIERQGTPVGTIALYNLSADGGDYEWGRLVVAPEHRGHGMAMRAFRLLLRYGGAIGTRRIWSEVLEDNLHVCAMHDTLGFRRAEVREHGGRRFVLFAIDL